MIQFLSTFFFIFDVFENVIVLFIVRKAITNLTRDPNCKKNREWKFFHLETRVKVFLDDFFSRKISRARCFMY
jgi:hypothetical protein